MRETMMFLRKNRHIYILDAHLKKITIENELREEKRNYIISGT